MKKVRFPKGQWSLRRCLDYILANLSEEDAEYLATASDTKMMNLQVHTLFGRWIRNHCGLWEHGTDRLAYDLVRAFLRGEIQSKKLEEGVFHHPDLPFDLDNTKRAEYIWVSEKVEENVVDTKEIRPDCSLTHPDNCSAVLIDVVVAKLRDERATGTT